MSKDAKQTELPVAGPKKREAVSGTKSYRSTQRYYREGRLYEPGEIITVTDEIPGKDWTLVDGQAVTEVATAKAPTAGRANDRDI